MKLVCSCHWSVRMCDQDFQIGSLDSIYSAVQRTRLGSLGTDSRAFKAQDTALRHAYRIRWTSGQPRINPLTSMFFSHGARCTQSNVRHTIHMAYHDQMGCCGMFCGRKAQAHCLERCWLEAPKQARDNTAPRIATVGMNQSAFLYLDNSGKCCCTQHAASCLLTRALDLPPF